MKKYLFIVTIAIFLSSCSENSNNKKNISEDDVKSYNITSSEIKFDEALLFPRNCKVVDSILIVFEPKLKDDFLSFYSLNSKLLIKKFGTIGNGRCDFLQPRFFQNYNFDDDKRAFLLGDSKYLYKLNIDSIVIGYANCENARIKNIPAEAINYNYILNFSETVLVANVMGDYQIEEFEQPIGKRSSKNYWEKIKGLDISDVSYTNQVYDAYYASYDNNIVIAYKNFKKIDLITSDGKVKSICFKDFDVNQGKIKKKSASNIAFADDALLFYSYVFTTSDYFYALYWNASRKKIKEEHATNLPEIHVFNWKGDFIAILKPDIAFSYFCVDEEHSKIFAIGISKDDEFGVYLFDKPLLN